MHRIVVIALLLVALLLTGCSNPWRENYLANPSFRSVDFEPAEDVTIRRVEPERLEAYHVAANERAIGRDLPPEEWPLEWQLDEKREFLRTIRVLREPKQVFYLGSSEFAHPGTLDVFSEEMRSFARSIGADYVVVAEQYIGPRETVIHVPVYTSVYGGFYGPRRGRHGRYYSDFTTIVTHEPRIVAVDSYHYIAYFLRSTNEERFREIRESVWGG